MNHFVTNDYMKGRMARQIPGAYYDGEGEQPGWYFDPDAHPHAVAVAVALFPELLAQGMTRPETTLEKIRPTDLSTPWADGRAAEELLPLTVGAIRSRLYPFQVADLAFHVARLRQDGGSLLGWDRGLGKTLGAFIVGQELEARRTLVICNRKAKQNIWIPEVGKWGLPMTMFDIGGSKARRDRVVREWAWSPDPWPWALIHIEALRLIDWAALPPIDLIVFDESHKLSNGGSKRQRNIPQFYRTLKDIPSTYRLGLSGSVIVNGPEDFWGTNHWLLPQKYKRRWPDWNDRYLVYVQGSGHKTLVDVNRERLPQMKQELGAFMTVRFKHDELKDVPKVLPQDIYVTLGAEQRRVYDELAAHLSADLSDGTRLHSANMMVNLMRLRQVACGLTLVDGGEGVLTDNAKIEAAIAMVEDNLPHKTVCFTWHRVTADRLAEELECLDIQCAKVMGGMTDSRSTAEISRFNEDPDCKVFVGTMKSIGESINLNASESGGCSDVVFVEASWVPTDMEQAQDRVAGGFRQLGNKRRISVTRIIARDTVDVYRVIPTLESKAAIRKLILGG